MSDEMVLADGTSIETEGNVDQPITQFYTDVVFLEDSDVRLVKSNVDDASVAMAAWVSTYGVEAEERLKDTKRVEGLIKYLMRENHETPFENAGSMTWFIKTPMDIGEEHLRHRIGWSYNKISGRYAELPNEFYLPPVSRPLVQTGKVGNYTFAPGEDSMVAITRATIMENSQTAWTRYQTLKQAGVANEVARWVLPSNLMTQYYATCNPRSLMHFLKLRLAPNAKQEIQSIARKMEDAWAKEMPMTYAVWKEVNGL